MKLLHISSRENKNSILKNGLMSSKISLPVHLTAFQGSGLEGDKCVYTWDSDRGQSTDKYVRDMIYCKLFIHPRNDMYDMFYQHYEEQGLNWWDIDDKDKMDFSLLGTELFGEVGLFDLFEIDIDEQDPLLLDNHWFHCQTKGDTPTDSCFLLNEDYAHDDKVLHISGSTIPPDKLKLVTTVKARKYKNDTIGVSYSKNI